MSKNYIPFSPIKRKRIIEIGIKGEEYTQTIRPRWLDPNKREPIGAKFTHPRSLRNS